MKFLDLGLTDYNKSLNIQKSFLEKRINSEIADTVLIAEHNPVVTMGRLGSTAEILNANKLKELNIGVESIERGGKLTYHGPGQIVLYPIINLNRFDKNILSFLRFLEKVIIDSLKEFGLRGYTVYGRRGVWIGPKKIASIGIAVKKWVTYHGFSINVNMDLSPFSYITMCGLKDVEPTSIKEELKRDIDFGAAKDIVKRVFSDAFGKNSVSELAYEKI